MASDSEPHLLIGCTRFLSLFWSYVVTQTKRPPGQRTIPQTGNVTATAVHHEVPIMIRMTSNHVAASVLVTIVITLSSGCTVIDDVRYRQQIVGSWHGEWEDISGTYNFNGDGTCKCAVRWNKGFLGFASVIGGLVGVGEMHGTYAISNGVLTMHLNSFGNPATDAFAKLVFTVDKAVSGTRPDENQIHTVRIIMPDSGTLIFGNGRVLKKVR